MKVFQYFSKWVIVAIAITAIIVEVKHEDSQSAILNSVIALIRGFNDVKSDPLHQKWKQIARRRVKLSTSLRQRSSKNSDEE